MTERPDLSALIGSRICHDLISPIGAIGNGVELMLMDGGAKSPELALISESVANANARIRFFRIAFGAAGGDTRIARTEVQTVLTEITKGSRLQIDWQSDSDLARREVKLAFLALQCVESATPWGGRVSVAQTGPAWTVTAKANRLRIDLVLWASLTQPPGGIEITPAFVHFAVLPEAAAQQSRSLAAAWTETDIRLTF
jgi:histidine phosphotransferase ChpT